MNKPFYIFTMFLAINASIVGMDADQIAKAMLRAHKEELQRRGAEIHDEIARRELSLLIAGHTSEAYAASEIALTRTNRQELKTKIQDNRARLADLYARQSALEVAVQADVREIFAQARRDVAQERAAAAAIQRPTGGAASSAGSTGRLM